MNILSRKLKITGPILDGISRTGQTEATTKAHRSGKHSSNASTAANLSAANPLLNPHMDGKDVQIRASADLADSCVIQVKFKIFVLAERLRLVCV
jgi:hypothetical protein